VELLPASVDWPAASTRARARLSSRRRRIPARTPDDSFDLVANRHMVQSVPHVERILAELVRVTKPGGHVHVLAEDYTMLHMMSGPLDPDVFWRKGPVEFAERTGTDSRIGAAPGR
jgi:SAM-dependent methyltransferase